MKVAETFRMLRRPRIDLGTGRAPRGSGIGAYALRRNLGHGAARADNIEAGRKMMHRIAHCSCGSLRVETTGEPTLVHVCHCRECQRRTGAPFGVSAFFQKTEVRAEGASKVYIRDGQEGRKLRLHFCPECGTTVYAEADLRPDHVSVAVGAFADPSFPRPTRSIWEDFRHSWVAFGHDLGHDLGHFSRAPTVARPAG